MEFFGNAWISPDFYSWEKNHGGVDRYTSLRGKISLPGLGEPMANIPVLKGPDTNGTYLR